MTPKVSVSIYATPPPALAEILARAPHFPLALPLARRLRFTGFPGGITEHARVLWASSVPLGEYLALLAGEGEDAAGEKNENGNGQPLPAFAAAYMDLSRGPETELWIYASLEARLAVAAAAAGPENDLGLSLARSLGENPENSEREETGCAVSLLREAKRLQDAYFTLHPKSAAAREHPDILVGNLNEALRGRLVSAGLAVFSTGLYDKFVFRVGELPDVRVPGVLGGKGGGEGEGEGEGEGGGIRLVWDRLRPEDIPFAISRSNIERKERTVKLLPSTAVYLEDGTPIAWAFLGPDSSLSGLHCEEPYRGRGIAKAVAVKLLRDHLRDFSDDGYAWADVAPDNVQSRSVCRSLNGKVMWQISWSRLNLDQSFPDE